ncbi:MAG TPA: aminotransferase class IV [Woeseiaceae bacterium]|nr:aminotransferase class IV [Woeseiaceae bacterium]
MVGSQGFVPDPRNEHVQIWLNGQLLPRAEARVSVFDAGFVLGDGVWEGLRLVNGRLAFLDVHLDRLYAAARALAIEMALDREALTKALYDTVRANGMTDGVHVRLMVTRGLKITPNQDPRATLGEPTVVIVAEYKNPDPGLQERGLTLVTSTYRTSTPDVFDMHLNTHSRLNFIQALLQAANLGADEALMLDGQGFVASCNATNFFIARGGTVVTSTGRCCFKGITRGHVVALCRDNGIGVEERDFTLAETYAADEAFVSGTFGGVTPVAVIDGRGVARVPGPLTRRIGRLYRELLAAEGAGGAPPA